MSYIYIYICLSVYVCVNESTIFIWFDFKVKSTAEAIENKNTENVLQRLEKVQ